MNEDEKERNVRSLRGLLSSIKSVAVQVSLDAGLGKGTPALIDAYNRCLKALGTMNQESDPLLPELFQELPAGADADQVGVAAALLHGYLGGWESDIDWEESPRHRDRHVVIASPGWHSHHGPAESITIEKGPDRAGNSPEQTPTPPAKE